MGEDFKCGVYKHYKGGYYQVLGLSGLSDDHISFAIKDTPSAKDFFKTDTPYFVVYICLYTDKGGPFLRVRSCKEFKEEVQWPDGSIGPRFKYISDTYAA